LEAGLGKSRSRKDYLHGVMNFTTSATTECNRTMLSSSLSLINDYL